MSTVNVSSFDPGQLDQLAINTIRFLSVDAVQKANSGPPCSDYMRPPIRLAALMEQGVIFVFTHDSVALGEDGSTHQPIEQLASLRAIPNLLVIRPSDANETSVAWRVAIQTRDPPVALILTRQDVPTLDRTQFAAGRVCVGRCCRWQTGRHPDRHRVGSQFGRCGRPETDRERDQRSDRIHAELGIV